MNDFVPPGSQEYFLFLAILVFGRGMDFFSTWIATPNLVLEANPIARRFGWRGSIVLNVIACLVAAVWPLPALVVTTTSLLAAAHNLKDAWLMRSLGEEKYRMWIVDRIDETPFNLYVFCLLLQTSLIAGIGLALVLFSQWHLVPFAVGIGIITYAVVVLFYTTLAFWRIRRSIG